MEWVEIKRDDDAFVDFLGGVVSVLDGPLPPPESENCDWCVYRERMKSGATAAVEAVPTCPMCSAPMRLRAGKYGEFWSCSLYPDCKGTRKV